MWQKWTVPSLLAANIMLVPTPWTFTHTICLASSGVYFLY